MEDYKAIYRKLFKFHEKYMDVSTDADWETCSEDMTQFKGPFETALVAAVVGELERVYNKRQAQ